MRANMVFNTNPPAVIRQIGETKPGTHRQISRNITERDIIMDFFSKAINILNKSQKEVRTKYPGMFK